MSQDETQARPLFDPRIVRRGHRRLVPQARSAALVKNPVMFVVEVGAVLTTILFVRDLCTGAPAYAGFNVQIALWLWFTVLFANFAEAMAEGRGKAQAETLRKTQDRDDGQAAARPTASDGERVPRDGSCARATSWSSRRAS